MKGKLITNKAAAICKMFHKCFLGVVSKIPPEPKSRWSFQIKPQVLRASGVSEFAVLPLPDVREISLCKDKAVRCEVLASWGVQSPV